MIDIRYLAKEDLFLIKTFILKEKKFFEKFFNLGWSYKNIKNHFHKENNISIGYFYNDILLGILIGEKILGDNNFDLDIHIMFIEKTKRRKKIGTKILNFIDKNKEILNIAEIRIEVSEKNLKAISFYEKNNFVFYKFRHNYYKENNISINAKCYKKIIKYE